jgi:hypothetical protein
MVMVPGAVIPVPRSATMAAMAPTGVAATVTTASATSATIRRSGQRKRREQHRRDYRQSQGSAHHDLLTGPARDGPDGKSYSSFLTRRAAPYIMDRPYVNIVVLPAMHLMATAPLIACPECDLPQAEIPLPPQRRMLRLLWHHAVPEHH